MTNIHITFADELNDFLPRRSQGKPLICRLDAKRSVKDFMESLGVPHAEVDRILINSHPVKFDSIVQQGDRIEVYPLTDLSDTSGLIDRNLFINPRFIADDNVSRLGRIMRALGFDVLQEWGLDDEGIVRRAALEDRIILTRDRGLLKRRDVKAGFYLRASSSYDQAQEIIRKLRLSDSIQPLTRCLKCNEFLREMQAQEVLASVAIPDAIRDEHQEFVTCDMCRQVYWEGSHFVDMKKRIQSLITGSELG